MPKGERGTSRPYLRGNVWWIRYSDGSGKERRQPTDCKTKREAENFLVKKRAAVLSGTLSPASVTVSDLLKLYLDDQRRLDRKQISAAVGYVRLHLDPAFGRLSPDEITTERVNRFIDMKRRASKLKGGYKNATINRWLEALKRAFTLGYQNTPPLVGRIPKFYMLDESGNVREGFLDYDQYVAMRDQLPKHQKLILVIGYHFGMRRGEILLLRWDQVDWETGLIRLEKKQTKAKHARSAPIYGELKGWLEMAYADPERGATIISFKGQGIKEVKTAWNKARERAGVPDLLVHDLRRTAVRNMVRAGIPEKQAMLISGHRTTSMFRRYDITDEKDIQAAGRTMESYMEKQALVRTKVRTGEVAANSSEIIN